MSYIWCWNLDTSESGSEIPGKFWNVVLDKDDVRNEEVMHRVKEETNTQHTKEQRRLIGLVTSWVETDF